ncbi:MAG: CheR family methyltransferase [Candidatus Nitrosotenuis sp.]
MSLEKTTDPHIDEIIKKASRFGFDFNHYKTTFLKRRIDVRLKTRGLQDYSEYSELLDIDITESNALFRSISINVTEFFRDKEVFSYLTQNILPKLLADKSPTMRVWSAGCATGEEPYTLAILLNEACKNQPKSFKVFATDINTNAVESAKKGVYSLASLKNFPLESLSKYFTIKADGSHYISQEIKNYITFNVADLTSFSVRFLDIIVCRNVFIYYTKETQDMILKKFHDCLKDSGYLVLGMDEGIRAEQSKLFESVNPKLRIYKKTVQ